jgi:hypothetical protein
MSRTVVVVYGVDAGVGGIGPQGLKAILDVADLADGVVTFGPGTGTTGQ